MTESKCPMCHRTEEVFYQPTGSLIDMKVFACSDCGFVFTTRSKDSVAYKSISATHETLSCDADYSSGRVGKEQMTGENIELFGVLLARFESPRVLDMSAARGHFLQYADGSLGASEIVGIEPDAELLEGVRLGSQTRILNLDYRDITLQQKFDIIYSCHTLEHYADPLPNLEFIANHLTPEGFALIDVPNMDSLVDSQPIDEFFYDKHRSYFTRDTLSFALKRVGLKVSSDKSTRASVKFLVRKSIEQNTNERLVSEQRTNSRRMISEYDALLHANRMLLPEAIELMCEQVINWDASVIIGCGRILDAAVRYGRFPVSRATYLVDNFLATADARAFGRTIVTFRQIPRIKHPEVFLMTRTATNSLSESICEWNSDSRIHTLSHAIEEVRRRQA